jgi:hypothetical protein
MSLGLSFGSVASDPEFFVSFSSGAFLKRLVMFVSSTIPTVLVGNILSDLLCSVHYAEESAHLQVIFQELPATLNYGDPLCFTISEDNTLYISIGLDSHSPVTSSLNMSLQAALGTALQSIFYGFNVPDVRQFIHIMCR